MSEQKMPDEIYIRPPRWGGDSISIAVRDDTGTKYHHNRVVEQLQADKKTAEDDFEAMYQMVKSRNAEIEQLQAENKALREALRIVLDDYKQFEFNADTGMYDIPIHCEEIVEKAEQTLKGNE